MKQIGDLSVSLTNLSYRFSNTTGGGVSLTNQSGVTANITEGLTPLCGVSQQC